MAAEQQSEHHVARLTSADRSVAVTGGGYFPVLVKLKDGALGAVVRGGAPHVGRAGRLDWIRSDDGGRTWTKPSVIVNSEWDDRNPAVGVMPDGAVVVAYAEASTYNAQGKFDVKAGVYTPYVVRSTDGGRTWSSRERLDAGPVPNTSPYGRIAALSDGTAMFGIYQYPSVCAGVIRSKDGGHTWGDVTMLPGHDETALLEVAPGRILAFTRAEGSTTHGVEMSESTDDGRTWSRPMSLLKPKQWPADVCQLRSGRLLLTYGNRTGPFGVGAVLSHDGGRTWDYEHRVLLAWDCQNTDCGYPSTVQLDDGTIVTLLYEVGPSLTYDVARAIVLRYTEAQLRDAMRGQAP